MAWYSKLFSFAQTEVGTTPPTEPLYTESVFDRTLVSTGTTFTPAMLLGWLRSAETGSTQWLHGFYDEMRSRDAHLDGELTKATRAISGAKLDILPYPPIVRGRSQAKTAEARRATEISEYVKDQLLAPEIRLDKAITTLCSGFWKGLAALEVEVEPGGSVGGRERLLALREIPSQRFRYELNSPRLMFQPDAAKMDLLAVEDLQQESRFVLLQDDAANPNPARRGLLRRCIALWLVRNEGLRWWARYVELFGIPYRIGKHAANDIKTQQALVTAAKNAGAAGWAVIPDSASLEFLNATIGTAGTATHEGLLDWCAREMSKVINGGTQTSDIQQNAGSKSSASVHDEQRQALAEARAIEIAAVIREHLIRPLVVRNFGPEAALFTPELRIHVEDEEDLLTLSQSLKNLSDAGVTTLPAAWFHEKTGIPMPEADEAVIAKPTPATPLPFPRAAASQSGEVLPFRAAASTPTVDPIVDRAEKLAPGSAEEIVAPYRVIIDRAVEEGVDLTTVLVRVLHNARTEAVTAERLQDLLAAVMLDATMRGIVDQRKTRRADA